MANPDLTLNSQQRMVDALLQGQSTSLRDFLTEHRGRGATYEAIAQELYAVTDKTVSVSYQTIKRWLDEFGIEKKAAS